MLITPEYVFKDVTHITPEWLAQKGIRALVLDIDNTLTADRSQELPEEVAGWLETMRRAALCRPDGGGALWHPGPDGHPPRTGSRGTGGAQAQVGEKTLAGILRPGR